MHFIQVGGKTFNLLELIGFVQITEMNSICVVPRFLGCLFGGGGFDPRFPFFVGLVVTLDFYVSLVVFWASFSYLDVHFSFVLGVLPLVARTLLLYLVPLSDDDCLNLLDPSLIIRSSTKNVCP